MPIYSRGTVNIKDIMSICVNKAISNTLICSKRPLRVKETASFVISQEKCQIKHPFDVQTDNIGGVFKRSDLVRFYECHLNSDGTCKVSSEVHVKKENGKVVKGEINTKLHGKWQKRDADLNNVYAVIRKRGDHQSSKASTGTVFVRQIIFVLTLEEFNTHYATFSSRTTFRLQNDLIILTYQIQNDEEAEVTESPHGNAIGPYSTIFRPIEHSARKELQHQTDQMAAPRVLLDEIEKNTDPVFQESTTTPNIKQIYNYRYNSNNSNLDPYLEILRRLLDQEHCATQHFNITDDSQPFIREVCIYISSLFISCMEFILF